MLCGRDLLANVTSVHGCIQVVEYVVSGKPLDALVRIVRNLEPERPFVDARIDLVRFVFEPVSRKEIQLLLHKGSFRNNRLWSNRVCQPSAETMQLAWPTPHEFRGGTVRDFPHAT